MAQFNGYEVEILERYTHRGTEMVRIAPESDDVTLRDNGEPVEDAIVYADEVRVPEDGVRRDELAS